jgi:lipopolysaccharide transport system ATP-binding protein
MSNPIAIEFDNISKQYALGVIGTGTLSRDLNRWWARLRGKEDPYLRIGELNDRTLRSESGFVWALKDINFRVEQGDVLGIIGKNGAGKSTLLKILSKVTTPTTGTIRARGRIASLLEVGTGFHQEMTGRENIYMNGSIMGMTKAEITRKLDEIVSFAGVERYLDTPVKRYSSGMTVRLGFAIAAHLDPEILVVDEVLAVGDAEFQRKAIGKMQDVARGEGRTVLFVSHNMGAVEGLCTKGIVLQNGTIAFEGRTAKEAVDFYLNNHSLVLDEKIVDQIKFTKPGLKIEEIILNDTDTCHSIVRSWQTEMTLTIRGHSDADLKTDVWLQFKTENGTPLATFSPGQIEGRILHIPQGNFEISKRIRLNRLNRGNVTIDLFMHHPMVEWQMKAPDCAVLECEGFIENMGHPTDMKDGGMFSLQELTE